MSRVVEIEEAIAAVEEALSYLDEAADKIGSAGNWGIFDMLGGGFLTSVIKRQRIQQADAAMRAAQSAIVRLRGELVDVGGFEAFDLHFNGFLGTADWLFDNVFVDAMVQQRISEARLRIGEARVECERIHKRLLALRAHPSSSAPEDGRGLSS